MQTSMSSQWTPDTIPQRKRLASTSVALENDQDAPVCTLETANSTAPANHLQFPLPPTGTSQYQAPTLTSRVDLPRREMGRCRPRKRRRVIADLSPALLSTSRRKRLQSDIQGCSFSESKRLRVSCDTPWGAASENITDIQPVGSNTGCTTLMLYEDPSSFATDLPKTDPMQDFPHMHWMRAEIHKMGANFHIGCNQISSILRRGGTLGDVVESAVDADDDSSSAVSDDVDM
eukprot:Gregarina_sp_Poly_1__7596@NODE_425_length_8620_cov_281_527534_g346_i0_p6_GENE_NODE_425_length_8620_cov_281_527534_g346_i0NODE_425_length_8620_cov_281_527534_g346_i0_p6_ORF_typecomplete_len232_score20_19_NODE_425_length_8620_cov_281_527534_g346_i049865681